MTEGHQPTIMDPFENLPETPDLSGEVAILSYKPVFNGPYSYVYRGKLQSTGEMVCILELLNLSFRELSSITRLLSRFSTRSKAVRFTRCEELVDIGSK
jgi:hypothetical protein